MDTDAVQNGGSFLTGFQCEVGHAVVHSQSTGLITHINRYGVIDRPHAHAAAYRELFGLAVGQFPCFIAVGAVMDVLQRAGTGDHQRHVAIDQHTGGHRLAVMGGGNGADIAVLDFGQDEHTVQAMVSVELRRHLVGDVQAKAAGHRQATAEPQVGDVAYLIARKTRILGGGNAAGGVLLQRTKHHARQLQKGLLPPLPGHPVGLRNGQDEILHPAQGLLRHLLPSFKTGAQGAVRRQGAQGQRIRLRLVYRPGAQDLPLFQQGLQRIPAQLVHGTARHVPGAAVHLHIDLFHRKGGAARLGKAALQALGGVGAGRLRFRIAVGKGLVAVHVGHGQLLAALFDLQPELHRHPAALAAVELTQGRQGLFGQLRIGFTAHAEHGAVDLSIQIAGGEAGAAERIFQQVTVVGAALAACQTGTDRRRHILRRAQAALDFGRCHADGLHPIQPVDDGVILQGKVVQTARLTLGQRVCLKGQAAGPGAGAPVAAAATQEGRHIALAADTHAERAVDKALGLDAAVLCDVLHLGQAQLTGQHHPGKAQLLQLQRALQGVDAHLGGAVAGQVGGDPPDELRHRQILADNRIRAALGHSLHGSGQRGQLPAVNGGVQCHVHLDTPRVAEPDCLLQAVRIKISGSCAGIEARKAQIYRVRTAEHRSAEHLFTAHRGKDLDLWHNTPFVPARSPRPHSRFRLCFPVGLLLGLQACQLLPQGIVFTPQRFIFHSHLILSQLCPGGIGNIILDLAAHILGAAGALFVLVQIIHGAEHRRLGHRKVFVGVQQLGDILIQPFGQRGDILFGIRRCDRIGRARNGHSHFINHRILTNNYSERSLWPSFLPRRTLLPPPGQPFTSYYNINACQEKVLFLNFLHIYQKDCDKNVSYGKNRRFSLHLRIELIIMFLLW